MNKPLKLFLLLFTLWVLAHLIFITIDGLSDTTRPASCILILGNTVNRDGSLSRRLQSRVDRGLELYRQKYAPKIIVSGGLGKEGYVEAREMKKYLVQKGVPPEDIITDEKAKTTNETMLNYLPIAKQHQFQSVIVVSQFFHITRSKSMLRDKGIQPVYAAHSYYVEIRDIYACLREFAAFYGYKFKYFFS